MTSSDETAKIAAVMAAAMDQVNILAEAVAGYRKKLVDGGVGPEAADQMAKDMHDLLLEQVRPDRRRR